MSDIEIETGIPLPPPRGYGSVNPALRALAGAEIGSSILITTVTPNGVRGMTSKIGKDLGVKFATREVQEGVRVWRVK